MDNAKTEAKPKRFQSVFVVLTPALIERLDAKAIRSDSNRSALIRQACEKYLLTETYQEGA